MLLRVRPTKRHLSREDGTPSFYLADTAWELVHRLNREEDLQYFDAWAGLGFTAIQMVALAELDGLRDVHPYGQRPQVATK